MRLLNTKTLHLEQFHNSSGLDYAVLSHTWEEDEVLFEDISMQRRLRPKWKKKLGAHKLLESARLAQNVGLEYIWIDTCCINKGSSAELSEAINSMYNWYRQSAVCYVYMSDYDSHDPENLETTNTPIAKRKVPLNERAFADSRWFTRGWTLQELIAPSEVRFYDRNWKYAGLRGIMATYLAKVTSIDPASARRCLGPQKGRLAREEDMAYCLMGLFDINMPLLYGEGRKAFRRLQEEILRKTNDQSILVFERFPYQNFDNPLLALSPRSFVNTHNVYRNIKGARQIQLTDIGLAVDLLLCPMTSLPQEEVTSKHYLGILDCFLDNMGLARPAILIVEIDGIYYLHHRARVYVVSPKDENVVSTFPNFTAPGYGWDKLSTNISKAERRLITIKEATKFVDARVNKPKSYPIRLCPIIQQGKEYKFGNSQPASVDDFIPYGGKVKNIALFPIQCYIWLLKNVGDEVVNQLLLVIGSDHSHSHYFHLAIPNDHPSTHWAMTTKQSLEWEEKIAERLIRALKQPRLAAVGAEYTETLQNGDLVTTKMVESSFLETKLFDLQVEISQRHPTSTDQDLPSKRS
ncbi:putative Heterokaryon incompatibility domain-containing protein [Seiridium cardinale]